MLDFPKIFGKTPTRTNAFHERSRRACTRLTSGQNKETTGNLFFAPKEQIFIYSSVVGIGTAREKGMDLSDNDIQRIVDRLRPTLPQILQNASNNQLGNQPFRNSTQGTAPGRGETQSSPAQMTVQSTSSAATEAAALSQLFRRPSYVQRHRYATPYQRYNRRPTATTTTNRPNAGRANNSGTAGVVLKEIVLLPDPLTDSVPRGRQRLYLEERGFIVSGHPISRSLNELELISSFETLFEHVLDQVTSNPK